MLTLKQAKAIYVGQVVSKYFPPSETCTGGVFSGRVGRVRSKVPDAQGVIWDLLYRVNYDDGDCEELALHELEEILVDREGVAQKCRDMLGAEAAAQAAAQAAAAAARQHQHRQHDYDEENDENQAAAEVHAKRRRTSGALGDVTARARNAVLGEERRSRREVKRRTDDAFEYEDERSAKRAAAAAAAGPAQAAARFGLRQPSQHAAAVAIANVTSESQELYPVGEGGMRLVGLPGHLAKIEVVNFMCHEHFTMEFGQHVTFVSGTNGSGKSAVLQALQCCLGVKASSTGRASTLSKFIRTGADEAIVRVTVCNRPYKGFDGYRHSLFGDSITVERRLGRSGTASSYCLKDHWGKVQGRRREDLDGMLQALGLNAANPVCVMTQDTARNFLAGSSTKSDQEKYALYMEATSLDSIAYNLEISKGQVRLMDESVQQIREEYDKMCAEHAELAKSIKALQGIEGWRQEVVQLEQALAWAVVDEFAAGAAKVQESLQERLPELREGVGQRVEELTREHAALQQGTEGKAHFLQTYNERTTALSAELDALKAQFNDARKGVRAAETAIRSLKEGLTEAQAQKESLENAAREVSDEAVQATQAAVQQYQQELEQAQAADHACQQELRGYEEGFRAAAAAHKEAYDRADTLHRQLFAAQSHLAGLEQQIEGVKEAGRSKVASFGGRPAVDLVQAIQRAKGQFSRLPIGPVGRHLALEDSRWARAVESALSFQLDSFLVHSMDDSRLLRGMINQHFQGSKFKPQVFVVNFDLPQHSIPPASQPPESLPTIYRLLSVSDRKLAAPILNNLVDQAHIEKMALGSDHGQCCQAAYHTPNVFACYAVDGSKYYRRGSTQTSIPAPHWLRFARLGQSTAQQTSELQQQMQQARQEIVAVQQEYEQARQAVAAAQQEEGERRRQLAEMKRRQFATHSTLTQLTQQPPPELAAATQDEGGAEGLQADIWQATQACIELDSELRQKEAALERAEAAKKEIFDAYGQKKAAIQRLGEENEQFLGTYHEELAQLAQVAAQLEEAQQSRDALEAKQAGWERQLAQMQAELALMEENAGQVCSREAGAEARAAYEARLRAKRDITDDQVATLLSSELLGKKVRQLEKKISEHEKAAGGSLAELQVRYEASSRRMSQDGRRFKDALATFAVVEEALALRMRKLSELDHKLEEVVNTKFRQYMWKKGHSGMIKLDRKARSLQLKVEIGKSGGGGREAAAGAVKDLKQLSGGERSYTTVAFTLALGDQTEMPFRAMDEFDVFMDSINRRVAMQNLFTFAQEHPELQFIFLTPQDIAAVEDARRGCQTQGQPIPDGFVRIVQMRPARANATRAQ